MEKTEWDLIVDLGELLTDIVITSSGPHAKDYFALEIQNKAFEAKNICNKLRSIQMKRREE